MTSQSRKNIIAGVETVLATVTGLITITSERWDQFDLSPDKLPAAIVFPGPTTQGGFITSTDEHNWQFGIQLIDDGNHENDGIHDLVDAVTDAMSANLTLDDSCILTKLLNVTPPTTWPDDGTRTIELYYVARYWRDIP